MAHCLALIMVQRFAQAMGMTATLDCGGLTPIAALAGPRLTELGPRGLPPALVAFGRLGRHCRDSGARGREGLGRRRWAAGLLRGHRCTGEAIGLVVVHPLDWVGILCPLSLFSSGLGCGFLGAILVALYGRLTGDLAGPGGGARAG